MSSSSIAFLGIALVASCLVIAEGIIVKSFMSAAARQPEMEPRLFARFLIGIAFVEGTFFINLAMAFVFR